MYCPGVTESHRPWILGFHVNSIKVVTFVLLMPAARESLSSCQHAALATGGGER